MFDEILQINSTGSAAGAGLTGLDNLLKRLAVTGHFSDFPVRYALTKTYNHNRILQKVLSLMGDYDKIESDSQFLFENHSQFIFRLIVYSIKYSTSLCEVQDVAATTSAALQ